MFGGIIYGLVPPLRAHMLRTVSRYLSTMTSKISSPHFNKILTPELLNLEKLFKSSGYEFRLVGGVVRDLLLGRGPKDIDIATDCTPQNMMDIFKRKNIRYIPTGLPHGTLTVMMGGISYEITTLRTDVTTDGRHASVKFVKDWRLDAMRRDLTVNAMSLSLDGQLYDYFEGEKHLTEKKILFVGDPHSRIKEDYLRILRYFRFYGRLVPTADAHDTATLEVIRELGEGLRMISVERIWLEMQKILAGNHAPSLVMLMKELGVAWHIGLPVSCNVEELERVWSCMRSQTLKGEGKGVCLQPVSLLVSLINSAAEFNILATKWKLSNKERHLGLLLADHRETVISEDTSIRYFQNMMVDKVEKSWVMELARYCDRMDYFSTLSHWEVPVMPVTGRDLLVAGIRSGPRLGAILVSLRKKWVESRYEMGKEELLESVEGEGKEDEEEQEDASKRRRVN